MAEKQDFEAVARRECAQLLQQVREAFRPSQGIEAIVLVAFTRGAAWALDIDVDAERAKAQLRAPQVSHD